MIRLMTLNMQNSLKSFQLWDKITLVEFGIDARRPP